MKKIAKKYVAPLALLASLSSCGDWLDINNNPMAATSVDPDYLFSSASINNGSNRMGGDTFIGIAIGAQVIADGGFCDWGGWWGEAEYSMSTYAYGNTWVACYSNGLNNLALAAKFAEEKGDMNTVAQCEIFSALIFYQLTMLYGDIPCLEALDPATYPQPKFDSQKSVLEHSIALLDHALSVATTDGAGAITGYDIFYGGDMTKWIKAAKSVKLQLLLTLYNREPERASEIAALINAGGMLESGADDWKFPFFDEAGSYNPNYELNDRYAGDFIETPGSEGDSFYMFFASNTVLGPMKQYNDPRIPIYFYANVNGGYEGLDTGVNANRIEGAEGNQYLSSPVNLKKFFTADMPDVLLSYQEVQFNLAEVYATGIGVTADLTKAQEAFKNGVTAACQFWGVAQADITVFVDGLPAFSTLDTAAILTLINNQRRIDFMSRPFEAFTNQRRTNMPVLTTPVTASAYAGRLFNRYEYPEREYRPNSNTPSPRPLFYEPMWFQSVE